MTSSAKILESYSAGGLSTFNILFGYEEALLRGFRLGFLTDQEYHHIKECDTLDDVKLNLQETDYSDILQNEAKVTVGLIRDKSLDKLVAEFEYVRAGAMQPLARFLDYITYDYMIDNVMLILKATTNNPNVVISNLIDQVHPLGKFKPGTLKSLVAFENSPKGYAELCQTVLVDTPIGKYFEQCLKESGAGPAGVSAFLQEMAMTKLESMVRKLYLEDFYMFCQGIGGSTAGSMGELLRARADAMAINITLNSFGTPLNDPNSRIRDRKVLYPSIGNLYPEGIDKLSMVGEEMELANVLRPFPAYRVIFDKHQQGDKPIDDAFYEREAMLNEITFESQFDYSCFYSYVRLKEQEIRNLIWICECIIQRQKDRIGDHFVPIFSKDAPFRLKA